MRYRRSAAAEDSWRHPVPVKIKIKQTQRVGEGGGDKLVAPIWVTRYQRGGDGVDSGHSDAASRSIGVYPQSASAA